MDSKICVVCKTEKKLIIFTTNIENVNSVIYNEVGNVTMRIEIYYQINENFFMEKIEMYYLQSLN